MKDKPETKFQIDERCPWCQGKGQIPIPNCDLIGEFGYYEACINGNWAFAPKVLTYCHLCFASETPKNAQGKNYPTLLDSLRHAKFEGSETHDLLVSCLYAQLRQHHQMEFVNKYLAELLRSE